MKLKISALTIIFSILTLILIIFSIYLTNQAFNYHTLKGERFDKCEEIYEKVPEHKIDAETFTLAYDWEFDLAWDSWRGCMRDFKDFHMMWEILRVVALVSVFLTILSSVMVFFSWKFDKLNKKEEKVLLIK